MECVIEWKKETPEVIPMKRIAVMQDLSCLGKCSLSVILPVISAMGAECAVLPTAVLSTHTAFPHPAVADLADFAGRILDHWKTLSPRFDGILTGYLASPEQARLAMRLMDEFAGEETKIIVDPAMGDHGKLYSGLTEEMVPVMASLCRRADLCLPNLTEGALMAGLPWRDRADRGYCREIAAELIRQGCKAVLLTGAEPEPGQVGYFYAHKDGGFCGGIQRLPRTCHGTGDLFSAVMAGAVVLGLEPEKGAALAAELIGRAISATGEDSRWGVAFEGELGWLAARTQSARNL